MNLRFIDPLVDCVFKAIFGVQANDWMLIDFLNAILKLPVPITALTIQNPYSERDFISDKQTIVDVLAKDALERTFQIEVQLKMHPALAERVLYTWASAHKSQLGTGHSFRLLKPTYSIWLMREPMTSLKSAQWHHRFEVIDRESGVALTDQMQIHVLQLSKWKPPAALDAAVDAESGWLYFLKEAKGWQELPATMHTRPLEKAMNVLRQFSENEADWHRYQAREHWLHLQATIEEEHREIREENARLLAERAQIQQDKAQAEQEKAQAEQDKAQEHARAERLLAKLRALGLEE